MNLEAFHSFPVGRNPTNSTNMRKANRSCRRHGAIMKPSTQFVIEWCKEDHCYVGSAPPLIGQCCHGSTKDEVKTQLTKIVDDLKADLFREAVRSQLLTNLLIDCLDKNLYTVSDAFPLKGNHPSVKYEMSKRTALIMFPWMGLLPPKQQQQFLDELMHGLCKLNPKLLTKLEKTLRAILKDLESITIFWEATARVRANPMLFRKIKLTRPTPRRTTGLHVGKSVSPRPPSADFVKAFRQAGGRIASNRLLDD